MAKQNKFITSLTASNKEIKAARAKIVFEDVSDAMNNQLLSLKKEKRELERTLMNLSDLSRDSELSLKVVKDNFNAKEWLDQIQATKVALEIKSVELRVAEETNKEWFADEA